MNRTSSFSAVGLRARRLGAGFLVAACFDVALLSPAARARAEIVGLRKGDVVHGEILSFDETGLRLRTFEGGEITLPWEVVAPEEAERLKKALGLIVDETDDEIRIPGVRITLAAGEVISGVIVPGKETADELVLKRADGIRTYPKNRIQEIEKDVAIEALEEYTPKELFKRFIDETAAPTTAEGHFAAADYARRIGAYDEALEHLKKCAEVDPGWRAEVVKAQREGAEKILASAEARGLFEKIRRHVRSGEWKAALASVEDLTKRFPDSPILGELDKEKLNRERILERQKHSFQSRISSDWITIAHALIRQKVREKELSMQEAKNWAEKELSEQVAARVAEKLGIDVGGVRELWNGRRPGSPRQASYGNGTFLVEKLKPKKAPQSSTPRRRATTQQPADQGPKKPTPEEWWTRTAPDERFRWLLAYYAERTKSLEVVRTDYSQCVKCSGRGFLSVIAQTGDTGYIPCDRCWQLGRDRVVVYR